MNKKLFLLKLTIIILIYLVIDSLFMYYYFIGGRCGFRINLFVPIHIITPIIIVIVYYLSSKDKKKMIIKKNIVFFVVLLISFYILLKLNYIIRDVIVVNDSWYSGCWTGPSDETLDG